VKKTKFAFPKYVRKNKRKKIVLNRNKKSNIAQCKREEKQLIHKYVKLANDIERYNNPIRSRGKRCNPHTFSSLSQKVLKFYQLARRQGVGGKRVPRAVKRIPIPIAVPSSSMPPPPPYSPRVKREPPRPPPPYSPRVKREPPSPIYGEDAARPGSARGASMPIMADFYDAGDGNLELELQDLIQSPGSDTILGIQSAPTVPRQYGGKNSTAQELIDAKRRQLDPISRELTYARTF